VTEKPSRREYEKPSLLVFGGVAELTLAVDMAGSDDGGKGNNKTG
jgi:hypothetical protein